jgi:uncharacterized protein (UPF0335 family)
MNDQGASYNAISEITRLRKENQQLREDKKELLAELYSLAFDEGVLGKGGALPKWTATLVHPVKDNAMETARRMWNAYAFRAGGITFDGKPLPTWDGLGDERQSCWVAAASVTASRIEKLEAALREIADGPRDADKSYVSLFHEIQSEARKALEGKDD